MTFPEGSNDLNPDNIVIGFAIVSHGDEGLLERLINRLNKMYDMPPVSVHHDNSQSSVNKNKFSKNVSFTPHSFKTGWGKFSVVRAGLEAIRTLYENENPDWFFLLSAADYPVRHASKVKAELSATKYDAFVDAQLVEGQSPGAARIEGQRNPKLNHFDLMSNRRLKWEFYIGARIWIPVIKRDPRWRIGRYTIQLPFAAPGPFGRNLSAYYGDHWFIANRRAASVLLERSEKALLLQRHLNLRAQADECYYQTVLCNAPHLSIFLDNKRYAEWNGGGSHPVMIQPNHLEDIMRSNAYFARKFDINSEAVALIDQRIDALD